MNRERAIAELSACTPEVRARGVHALYLFGSMARDAAKEASDIDIFLDTDPSGRFNAFDLVDVKTLLERRLNERVDVTTREGLHPKLRGAIERKAIRIF